MNNVAIFDIDGVLCDFEGRLNFYIHTQFGENKAWCNRTIYSLEERYKDRPDVLKKALEFTADPNSYYALQVNEPIVRFIHRIYKDGFDIRFVSSRPIEAENVTRRYIKKHLNCEFFLNCGVKNKAEFISTAKWKDQICFAVDDSPEVVKSISGLGFNVFCYDQMWNEGIFPRLYARGDGELMVWEDESVEAQTFWVEE